MKAWLCFCLYATYIQIMSNENKILGNNSGDLMFGQANSFVPSSLNQSIHAFDYNLICDYFLNTERQGPGSPEITLKALSFIDNLTDESLVADIGCGTGGQTMILAGAVQGQITGLDLCPDFIISSIGMPVDWGCKIE